MAVPIFIGGNVNKTYPKTIAITTYAFASMFVGAGLSYSITPGVPTGLSFNNSTGDLTGTPTTDTAQTVYTVTATNGDGSAQCTVRLRVITPDFYIAPAGSGGSDANPGTRASPWLTFTHADTVVTAGQKVMVRGGTYAPTAKIEFFTSGTSGNLIEYIGHPDETAIVTGTGMGAGIDTMGMSANFIAIRHLRFEAAKQFGIGFWDVHHITVTDCICEGSVKGFVWTGGSTRTASHTHTIVDNVVYNCVLENVNEALLGGGWAVAIAIVASDNSVVSRNRVFENWGEGIGLLSCIGVTVTDNIVYDNYSIDIYGDNTQGCTITSNIVFNSEDPKFFRTDTSQYAKGIVLADEDLADNSFELNQTNMTITGNTLVGASMVAPFYDPFGRGAGITSSTLTPNTVSTSIGNLSTAWTDQRWPKVMVRGRTTGVSAASDTTSHTITLPANIVVGETLLVVFSVDGDPTVTVDTGFSGINWVVLGQSSNSTVVTQAIVYKAVAEGGDVLRLTTSTSQQSSHISRRMANAGAIDATFANGSSTNSNPPSHTPAVGNARYLWVVTRTGDSTVQATAAPSGFRLFQTRAASGANGAVCALAERHEHLSVKDPGTFTSASEQWVSATIAVQALSPQPLTQESQFEHLAVATILATTNLKDTSSNNPPTDITDIQDSPDAPDGDWWTAVDPTQPISARCGYNTPAAPLQGTQTVRAYLRRTSGGVSPLVTISLYESGALVRDLLVDEPITSATGQIVEATFDPSELADQTGANMETRIDGTPG